MKIVKDVLSSSFSPTICVTHKCNLDCVYCYQKLRSNVSMSFDTGKKCIDDIFANIPEQVKIIEISFIGGEPLLEVELIKSLYHYTLKEYPDDRVHFFATTNGTVLSAENKRWFAEQRKRFILGLSLDGTRSTHNYNRSNSFDLIDINFFIENWPNQGPKMTISKKTLETLAEDIIFIHNKGFKEINGVNFAEGNFDWDQESCLKELARQLHILLDFYSSNYDKKLDQMFGKRIEFCASSNSQKYKSCGIGERTVFYDCDGEKYPCSFVTPMTFSKHELEKILSIDFEDMKNFRDDLCLSQCYLSPVCGTCAGANYLVNGSFSKRIKTRCKMYELISLYIAEYHTRKILTHRELYEDDNQVFYLIEAIKGIKKNYFDKYKDIMATA